MNRLKALPWTQILLFLLLVSTVMHYIEMQRVKKSVDYIWSEVQGTDPASGIDDVEKRLVESNQRLQEIEFSLRCMSSRFDSTCLLAGRSRPNPTTP